MDTFLRTVAAAAGLFAATNIDDMVVLAVLNASSRAGGPPTAGTSGPASTPAPPPWSSCRWPPGAA